VYARRNSGVSGEREREQEKKKLWRDSDVETRREKTGIGWKERKEGAECTMRGDRQSSTFGMECSEMREREGKERGEILNEDGREIRWMKELWKRKERI
jgi:hypothetical protein